MLKDVTLGQFFPGSSLIHRLDPRVKIIASVAFIVSLFVSSSFYGYGICTLFLIWCIATSKISPKMIIKSLKPLVIILIFTGVLNMLYTPGHALVSFWVFNITREGLYTAAFMMIRIILLITATSMLTYTTSPIALTDGLERLLSPLKKLKVPVHEFSMMMTIALRFIPTLIEETDKIMAAQKARGADFESGNLISRAKALIPILVPLFISAFRRADELATAMECRLYHGGEGRTRLNTLKMMALDWRALVFMALFCSIVINAERIVAMI
ncbi:MAG: energy-coupling factor transporter transmembrane component T [Clostridiaceae bacterium]|nr:energy-coupling factor transporter transmembrane component T [Clostridiaceae bacterium]